jgi:hypothetical protein
VNPFGVNAFSGFNVQTLAIEVPIRRLTRDGQPAGAGNGTIGVFARTLRQAKTLRRGEPRLRELIPKALIEGDGPAQCRAGQPAGERAHHPLRPEGPLNATLPEQESLVGAYRASTSPGLSWSPT